MDLWNMVWFSRHLHRLCTYHVPPITFLIAGWLVAMSSPASSLACWLNMFASLGNFKELWITWTNTNEGLVMHTRYAVYGCRLVMQSEITERRSRNLNNLVVWLTVAVSWSLNSSQSWRLELKSRRRNTKKRTIVRYNRDQRKKITIHQNSHHSVSVVVANTLPIF